MDLMTDNYMYIGKALRGMGKVPPRLLRGDREEQGDVSEAKCTKKAPNVIVNSPCKCK